MTKHRIGVEKFNGIIKARSIRVCVCIVLL